MTGAAVILLLFPVAAFVPGFAVVRRFPLPDALRLPVSVAVSIGVLYAAGFALYLAGAGPWAAAGVFAGIAALTVLERRALAAFLRLPATGTVLLHAAIFASWVLLLALLVRNFSGGTWAGDWQEHYERALFFAGELPLDFRFTGDYALPARPPLQNVVAALFLRLVGTAFGSYQLVATLLASLEFLAAASLWAVLAPGRAARGGLLVLAALLCLNPSVVVNATYPWTRALTNFFVLEAAALYVVAARDLAPALRRWSLLLLGLGAATHYSAGPYAVALAAVEAWLVVTRRLPVREAVAGALLLALPVAPWLAFSLAEYGAAGTFLTNTTVMNNAPLGATGAALRAVGNLVTTLVPHPLREVQPLYDQEYAPAYWRDYAFLVYQLSLPALLGSAGGLVVLGLLGSGAARTLRAGGGTATGLVATYVALVLALGIATIPEEDPFGAAHLCLQPLAIAGVVYLAACWSGLPAWVRALLGAGLAVDAGAGIGLQFWMQQLTLQDLLSMSGSRLMVSSQFGENVGFKLRFGQPFLADLPGALAAVGVLAAALALLVAASARRAQGVVTPRPDAPAAAADA